MSYLLILLLFLLALAITFIFAWALWRASHLDDNTMLIPWIKCTWRGQHRPVRHPLGGFRCLDCFETARDLDGPEWMIEGGYVDPDRHTYTERRGM